MSHHACYALAETDLDVVVIDESRNMQSILRSILGAMKVRRVRLFSSIDEALPSMLADPPNLIVSEWRLGPSTGQRLLSMLRARFMVPLCYVPVIFLTSQATAGLIERAMTAGAHMVLIKPISPTLLAERIAWLRRDDRRLELGEHGLYEIEGLATRLREQRERKSAYSRAAQENVANGVIKPPPLNVALPVPPKPLETSDVRPAARRRPMPQGAGEGSRSVRLAKAALAAAGKGDKAAVDPAAAWLEFLRVHDDAEQGTFADHAKWLAGKG